MSPEAGLAPGEGHPSCFACKKALEQVFAEPEEDSQQWDLALIVGFDGSWGMFIDPEQEKDCGRQDQIGQLGRYSVVICHECAHQMCETLPWVEQLLEPYSSHLHPQDRDWRGHKGQDLDLESALELEDDPGLIQATNQDGSCS